MKIRKCFDIQHENVNYIITINPYTRFKPPFSFYYCLKFETNIKTRSISQPQ